MGLTAEQVEARRTRVHASDVPLILDVSPFGGPRDVWWEKIHGVHREGTDAMDMGNRFEPMLLSAAKEYLQGVAIRRNVVRYNGLFGARLDAMILKAEPRAHLEAKYRSVGKGWGKPSEVSAVPEDILAQTAMQFHCARTEVCWVPALLILGGHPKLRMYKVERDQTLVKTIVDYCWDWWQRYIIPKIEPPGDPPGIDLLKAIVREEATIDLDSDTAQIVEQFERWDAATKRVKTHAGKLKRELIARLGTASIGRFDGGQVTYLQHDRIGYSVKPSKRRKFTIRRSGR